MMGSTYRKTENGETRGLDLELTISELGIVHQTFLTRCKMTSSIYSKAWLQHSMHGTVVWVLFWHTRYPFFKRQIQMDTRRDVDKWLPTINASRIIFIL